MQAQRARGRLAVDSYEGESASVSPAIGSDEFAPHKPNVSVKPVGRAVAGAQVGAGAGEGQIDFANSTAEVGN